MIWALNITHSNSTDNKYEETALTVRTGYLCKYHMPFMWFVHFYEKTRDLVGKTTLRLWKMVGGNCMHFSHLDLESGVFVGKYSAATFE